MTLNSYIFNDNIKILIFGKNTKFNLQLNLYYSIMFKFYIFYLKQLIVKSDEQNGQFENL